VQGNLRSGRAAAGGGEVPLAFVGRSRASARGLEEGEEVVAEVVHVLARARLRIGIIVILHVGEETEKVRRGNSK
jgi:hypothetical protein